MKKKYLFVGGKFDGHCLEVDGLPLTFTIPYLPENVRLEGENEITLHSFHAAEYKRSHCRAPCKEIIIYVLSGLSEMDVFEMLVTGYQGVGSAEKVRT